MRKLAAILVALSLWGCSIGSLYAREDEGKLMEYSSLEVTLSDISKKITAYYDKQEMGVPHGFDGTEFVAVVEKIYPDKEKVEMIRDTYGIRARALDGTYSVVLCDRAKGNKLVEDFGCTLNKVDVRYWDKEASTACEFEVDWRRYCE